MEVDSIVCAMKDTSEMERSVIVSIPFPFPHFIFIYSAKSICERLRPCVTVTNTRCVDDEKEPGEKYKCVCLEGHARQVKDQDNDKAPCWRTFTNTEYNRTLIIHLQHQVRWLTTVPRAVQTLKRVWEYQEIRVVYLELACANQDTSRE